MIYIEWILVNIKTHLGGFTVINNSAKAISHNLRVLPKIQLWNTTLYTVAEVKAMGNIIGKKIWLLKFKKPLRQIKFIFQFYLYIWELITSANKYRKICKNNKEKIKVLILSPCYATLSHSLIVHAIELSLERRSIPSRRQFSVSEIFMILLWYFYYIC